MQTTINGLPYELLAAILEEATRLNLREIPRYTYGLSQAPEPMRRDVRMQRVVRGHVGPDTLKWNATDAIRRVNRTWHDWACRYALATLYITRWRGGERWFQSRILANLHAEPSGTAVYQDPYSSLRKTIRLFSHHTTTTTTTTTTAGGSGLSVLASCVRRIWLDGYYSAETTGLMFELLLQLPSLEYLTLPWMALRHGTAEQWSRLLVTNNNNTHHLSSLEFLCVNLKASQMIEPVIDYHLNSSPISVDFHLLTRLKLVGETNHLGLTDADLIQMSRTATNLHEIHITSSSSSSSSGLLSIKGVMALVHASRESLNVLYTPISPTPLPSSPSIPPSHENLHPCMEIQECCQLRNLTITLPSICTDLFFQPSSHWTGEIQIRTASLCPSPSSSSSSSSESWQQILHRARNLIQTRPPLSIEIYFQSYIFEPSLSLVHGPTIQLHQLLSSSPTSSIQQRGEIWPSSKIPLDGPEWKPHVHHDDDDETQPSPYSYVRESTFLSFFSAIPKHTII